MATPEDLMGILGSNERIEIYLKQKFYHLKLDIDSIAITNERIILRHPHALGLKKNYTDYNYNDLENVTIEKGVMRSTIKITLKLGTEPITLNDIPNAEAQKAYVTIREKIINHKTTSASVKEAAPDAIFCRFCGAKNKLEDVKCVNCEAPLT